MPKTFSLLPILVAALAFFLTVPTQAGCPQGDANGDCIVNFDDLQLLVQKWLSTETATWADLNDDKLVGMVDFSILSTNWLKKASPLLISEFMADNTTTLPTHVDSVGVYPDWIEIYNQSTVSVSLAGWHLTDDESDLNKWQFPAGLTLSPDQYLVVFASGKTQQDFPENYPYLDTDGHCHTNFKLNSDGEYLALIMPDMSVGHEYTTNYPKQFRDISYGLPQFVTSMVSDNSISAWHVPSNEEAGSEWILTGFDDYSWNRGASSLGFSNESTDEFITSSSITATAADGTYGSPANVVNESEFNPDTFEHYSNQNGIGMWVTDFGGVGNSENHPLGLDCSTWIKLDFDQTYRLGIMYLWNQNQWVESNDLTDRGLRNVSIHYTNDGINWMHKGDYEIPKSPGGGPIPPTFELDFAGIEANSVLITASVTDGNWGSDYYGLSEIKFETSCQLQTEMLGTNTSLWSRSDFEVDSVNLLETLTLRIKYEDGFVAYLNGQKIARRNAPESTQWNSAALSDRPDNDSLMFENIDISTKLNLLQASPAKNVLAIHGLNDQTNNSAFLIAPELYGYASSIFTTQRYFAEATPGAINGTGTVDLGPIISDVTENMIAPDTASPITITARIQQSLHTIANVTLHYRVMFEGETSSPMCDDGSNGDATACDNIYTAIIPAGTALPGQMVRWYVTATDIPGNPSRWPLFHDQLNSPEYFGTVIIDPSISTNLPILHWFVEEPEAARTDTGTRASAYFNGNFYDNFFVRRRGYTTAGWNKRKFKFDFNPKYHFEYSPSEKKVEEFNLQSHYMEIVSTAYMRENAAFKFFQEAGTPAPNTFHLHLRQNGNFYGLYSFIEQIDETFLERNGLNPKGLMYKATGSSADGTLKPNPATHAYNKILPDDNQPDVFDPNFVELCQELSDSNRFDYMFDYINLPQVINEMACQAIVLNHDRLPKNYYIYQDPKTLLWSRLPWDTEQAFALDYNTTWAMLTGENYNSPLYGDSEHPQEVLHPDYYNRLHDVVLDNTVTRQMYVRRLRTLMDQYLDENTGYFESLINGYKTLIEADADLDNVKWGAGNIDTGVHSILNESIPTRRTQLFTTYGPSGSTPLIPQSQPVSPGIDFGSIEYNPASYNQDEEYIELVNPNSYAVDISGWVLTGGVEFTFPAGAVIPANDNLYISPDIAAFRDRTTSPKGGEGNFVLGNYMGHLSSWSETLTLMDTGSRVVDTVTYTGSPSDQQHYLRITELTYNPLADPNQILEYIELKNIGTETLDLSGVKFTEGIDYRFPQGSTTSKISLATITDTWKYEQTNIDLGTQWHQPSYDDRSWPDGQGLLYVESSSLPAPKNTPLTIGADTYYFRKHFNLDADPAASTITLQMNTIIDDGAVFYLNGVEVYRLGIADGPIDHNTRTDRAVNNAVYEGPFTVSSAPMVQGDNVLAVEVHQKNSTSSDIVFGMTLDATITSVAPQVTLDADSYILLVKNQAAFESRYGSGHNIAGQYIGSLDNGGEKIKLEDYTNSTILSFNYNDSWYNITDGEGFSLTIKDPANPDLTMWDSKAAWRPSVSVGGSPGTDDSGIIPPIGSVIINEVLAHSDAEPSDWVELYNTTDQPVNIGGWFLSDNNNDDPNRMKYQIAEGTMIAPFSYIVFYENLHLGNVSDPGCNEPFQFSENGETVYLQSGQGEILTGYYEEESFGASLADVAFGRYQKSTGAFNFVAMSSNTPSSINSYPKVGPIVISEIMYNPSAGGTFDNDEYEYIELKNITGSNVLLQVHDNNLNVDVPWKFTDGIDYTFPLGTTIPANGCIVIAKNLTAFTERYGSVPAGAQLLGPFENTTGLSNGGEKLEISMPGDVDDLSTRQYIRIDRVNYSDGSHPVGDDPWPVDADGNGKALDRKVLNDYGNDVANWQAMIVSPGI